MVSNILKFSCILTSKLHSLSSAANSTIFALSSGFGKCGVAVIRISGPNSKVVLTEMAGFNKLPEPRKIFLRKIRNPVDQSVLDHGLVIWFPGPKSFTGEDCCELQIHGGKAVIASILKALSDLKNLKPAMPGEFTKRAFYSGKLDLTEVEGLADLIEAETEAQRKQAVSQMDGALSRIYNGWRDHLTKSVAQVEAYIDFSESENIEEDLIEDTIVAIKELLQSIYKHMVDGRRGERLRDGVQTVILGAPNVGKSSLLNLLCRKEEAIVSPIAGTTRDIVSSSLDIGGYPLVVKDTAGLRQCSDCSKKLNVTSDPIEIEGMSRAINAALSADLILLLIDPTHLDKHLSLNLSILNYCRTLGIERLISMCDTKLRAELDPFDKEVAKKCLIILNKSDTISTEKNLKECFDAVISCKNEEGVDAFLQTLTSNLESLCGRGVTADAACNQIRHRQCLSEVISSLETCLTTTEPDIVAHHIRQALFSLGKITGHVSTEQILDVIFKNFCVGK